ncbi:hypothetical protein NDU88_003149 [Pleurodeles waltl]|uniref:Uncharacterized protein n=1 Tax=Pleurodeles waltl TaxID=8319 RepID=A0AAV7WRK5_PLEWA|nr:hypothetical protein NDU88_003149 [Pleurodeles waltl]
MGPETGVGGEEGASAPSLVLCLVRPKLAQYFCSGPRWGFRSGHSELPVVAGLCPKPLQTAHSRKEENNL